MGVLAALARETSRMRIGTLVSTVRLRHPTFLAAQVITVDHVSGGRAAIRIGAGEPEQNATVGNPAWSAQETLERLDEQAGILAALLRGRPIEHDGPFYPTNVEAMPQPLTRPGPPLVRGARPDGPEGSLPATRTSGTASAARSTRAAQTRIAPADGRSPMPSPRPSG